MPIKQEPFTPNKRRCLNFGLIAPKAEQTSPDVIAHGVTDQLADTARCPPWKMNLNISKLALSLSSPSPPTQVRRMEPLEGLLHTRPPPPPPGGQSSQSPRMAQSSHPPPEAGRISDQQADTADPNLQADTADPNRERPGDTGGTGSRNAPPPRTSEVKRIQKSFAQQKKYLSNDPELEQHLADLVAAYPKGSSQIREFKRLIGNCHRGNFDTLELRAVKKGSW